MSLSSCPVESEPDPVEEVEFEVVLELDVFEVVGESDVLLVVEFVVPFEVSITGDGVGVGVGVGVGIGITTGVP